MARNCTTSVRWPSRLLAYGVNGLAVKVTLQGWSWFLTSPVTVLGSSNAPSKRVVVVPGPVGIPLTWNMPPTIATSCSYPKLISQPTGTPLWIRASNENGSGSFVPTSHWSLLVSVVPSALT